MRLAIAEDSGLFRSSLTLLLRSFGAEVIASVASGAELLAAIRDGDEPPDAVILDMVMPERDGFEALREMKELFPEIRVVAVSGAADSALYLTVSAHLGADASLDKSKIGALCPLLHVVLDR